VISKRVQLKRRAGHTMIEGRSLRGQDVLQGGLVKYGRAFWISRFFSFFLFYFKEKVECLVGG